MSPLSPLTPSHMHFHFKRTLERLKLIFPKGLPHQDTLREAAGCQLLTPCPGTYFWVEGETPAGRYQSAACPCERLMAHSLFQLAPLPWPAPSWEELENAHTSPPLAGVAAMPPAWCVIPSPPPPTLRSRFFWEILWELLHAAPPHPMPLRPFAPPAHARFEPLASQFHAQERLQPWWSLLEMIQSLGLAYPSWKQIRTGWDLEMGGAALPQVVYLDLTEVVFWKPQSRSPEAKRLSDTLVKISNAALPLFVASTQELFPTSTWKGGLGFGPGLGTSGTRVLEKERKKSAPAILEILDVGAADRLLEMLKWGQDFRRGIRGWGKGPNGR